MRSRWVSEVKDWTRMIKQIRQAIQPFRQALLVHPIYRNMRTASALRTFMEHHVFAVWDFMSLLKSLQQKLCCVSVPWLPSGNGEASRFINEIVLVEESDDDGRGQHASHFELYHRAMTQFGADTSKIDRFLSNLRSGQSVHQATAALSSSIRSFVSHTFAAIDRGDLCEIASTFTFGREDLLPDVFQRIVDELNTQTGGGLHDFEFYLRRHIELDGEEHGPRATQFVESLCGSDQSKWRAAEEAAVSALKVRLAFWDAIHLAIMNDQADESSASSVRQGWPLDDSVD
jgi:hypothetical protein